MENEEEKKPEPNVEEPKTEQKDLPVIVEPEQKVEEIPEKKKEVNSTKPEGPTPPVAVDMTNYSQHLSTSSDLSDTPLIPEEKTEEQTTITIPEPEAEPEKKERAIPEINILPPTISIEPVQSEPKIPNSEKLKRLTQESMLKPKSFKKKRGSLELGDGEVEEEEILERHSIDVPVPTKEKPKLSIEKDIDVRPSLDFSRVPRTTNPIQRSNTKRPKIDLPLMKFISAKPKVIHVRKRSWNEDHYAFHTFENQAPKRPGEEDDEILERKSFGVMREYAPKQFQTLPPRRSEDGFGRTIKSNRESLMDDLPPLEDPEESGAYDPEREEELSNIGKRIEQKKQEYERIRTKYENRYRFDPRFYFFFHLAWILSVGFFGGLLIYLIELSYTQISFIDAVFMAFSACTVTGLFAVNFALWSIYGKIVVFMCILLGTITLTTVPLMIIRCCEARKRMYYERILHPDPEKKKTEKVSFRKSLITITKAPPTSDIEYLAYKHAIIVLLLVQGVFQFTSFLTLGFYLQFSYSLAFLAGNQPFWCALFLTFSAWGNAGFTVFPDNLVRFRNDVLVNIVIFIMAQCGNTLFPFIYRSVISILVKIPSSNQVVYQFILDHHHRMTIHCFPATQTKVYAITSLALQCLGFFSCMIMEYSNTQMEGTFFKKVMIALFHSGSSRTSGFNTVDISAFYSATLMIYILMMRTKPQMLCSLSDQKDEIANLAENEYQLEKLQEARMMNELKNDYTVMERDNVGNTVFESITKMLQQFFRRETIQDYVQSWLDALKTFVTQYLGRVRSTNVWLMIIIFLITTFEREKFISDPNGSFTIFKLIFEVISAFGNVGLSLGYPGLVTSFCSVFSDYSKVLIIFVMVMGRHRGLFGAMQDQNVDFVLD